MKELLQELANQIYLVKSIDEIEWDFSESFQNQPLARNQNSPSVCELARHLSNWAIVFIPPLKVPALHGDMELVSCLESPDHHVSTLAASMLGYEEFNFVGSIEKFTEMLNHRCQIALRLEVCRLLFTRYHDLQP